MNRDEVLTNKRIQMFSRRAREYMLAYEAIELVAKQKEEALARGENQEEQNDSDSKSQFRLLEDDDSPYNHYLIEKVVKTFKVHRSMDDIDCGYIREIVEGMVSIEVGLKVE